MKMLELFSMKRGTVGAPYVKKVPQVALYLNLILLFSYGVAFGLCRFSYTFCFKVFLEIFFHFFGSGFSDNSNTVVVDFYTLVSFPIFVFGFADYKDGIRYQSVEIYYNGVGIIREPSPEEMEEYFQEHLKTRGVEKTA